MHACVVFGSGSRQVPLSAVPPLRLFQHSEGFADLHVAALPPGSAPSQRVVLFPLTKSPHTSLGGQFSGFEMYRSRGRRENKAEKIRPQEKGVLAKGVLAQSSVTPKETKNTQGYTAQQYVWHSEPHSQERRYYFAKTPF